MTEEDRGPEGLWKACAAMEAKVVARISSQLDGFLSPLRDCYEAGVQAPTLPARRGGERDLRLAAIFLKRSLTDLRTVWILLERGYTFGAAAVAAALWEHALVVSSVAGDVDRSSKVLNDSSGDLPWGPIELAKWLASRETAGSDEGSDTSRPQYERAWREIYGGYKFLCKIKHPTMRHSVPSLGNATNDDGEFVVMAAPDVRPRDLPLKATVLMISISRCFEAVDWFVGASEVDTGTAEYSSYDERMRRIVPSLREAYSEAVKGGLPFDIGDEKIGREYADLRRSQSS